MKHIIKRKGHQERFDERKVYATCYAACLNATINKTDTETICNQVAKEIAKWIKTRDEVTSHHIFKQVIRLLKKHDKNAAFMYETHRDIA